MLYFPKVQPKERSHLAFGLLLVSIIFMNSAESSYAQIGYEAFAVAARGAGGAYSVLPRGVDAIGLNPALLGLEPENRLEISVLPISAFGLSAGPSFRNVSAISDVFGRRSSFIDNSVSQHVDSLLSNNALSGRGDVEIFGAYYYVPDVGGFGLAWTTHAGVRTDIPQNFLDYFGIGVESNIAQSSLNATNFDIQGLWYSEYSLSFGRELLSYPIQDSTQTFLGSFGVGAAVKYVAGIGYAGLDPGGYISANPINSATTLNVNYTMRFAYPDAFDPKNIPNRFNFSFLSSATAGSGIGADLGLHAGFFRMASGANALTVGASVTDIGSITWTKNTSIRQANHITDTIRYQGSTVTGLNDSLAVIAGTLTNVASFTTALPTTMRIGAALDLDALGISPIGTSMTFATEYSNGLTRTVGALQSGRIGLGVALDHPGKIFSFRAGIGYVTQSGASGLSLGIGTTIMERVALDVATSSITQVLGTSGYTDIAFSLRILFD